jgi:hypothetical protein
MFVAAFWQTNDGQTAAAGSVLIDKSLANSTPWTNGRTYSSTRQRKPSLTHSDPSLVTSPSIPVSYTHLTLPTTIVMSRSRWSPYH